MLIYLNNITIITTTTSTTNSGDNYNISKIMLRESTSFIDVDSFQVILHTKLCLI